MKMNKQKQETIVGAFIILGLIILTLIVFFASGVYLFRSGYALDVKYDYVSILDKGAPVRMSGVKIGEVSKVNLFLDGETQKTRVNVRLFIEKDIVILDNYEFSIRGTHILSEPHIEISPVEGGGKTLTDGAVVEGYNPIPLESLIEHANDIADELNSILSIVHGAISDATTGEALRNIIVQWSKLSESLNLIVQGSEADFKNAIRNLGESTDSISKILAKIEAGEGTAGKLVMDDDLYNDMREFVAEIKARPWRLMKRN